MITLSFAQGYFLIFIHRAVTTPSDLLMDSLIDEVMDARAWMQKLMMEAHNVGCLQLHILLVSIIHNHMS